MCTKDTLSLTPKGVPPVEPFYDTSMWDCWADQRSPNSALVLLSMVCALVHKAMPRRAAPVMSKALSEGLGTKMISGTGGTCPSNVASRGSGLPCFVATTK